MKNISYFQKFQEKRFYGESKFQKISKFLTVLIIKELLFFGIHTSNFIIYQNQHRYLMLDLQCHAPKLCKEIFQVNFTCYIVYY